MEVKRSNEQTLKEVIDQLLKAYRLEPGIEKARLAGEWERLLGPALAKRTRVASLEKGRLTIHVRSAALREELSMSRSRIMELLNQQLGKEVVTEVIIR